MNDAGGAQAMRFIGLPDKLDLSSLDADRGDFTEAEAREMNRQLRVLCAAYFRVGTETEKQLRKALEATP